VSLLEDYFKPEGEQCYWSFFNRKEVEQKRNQVPRSKLALSHSKSREKETEINRKGESSETKPTLDDGDGSTYELSRWGGGNVEKKGVDNSEK